MSVSFRDISMSGLHNSCGNLKRTISSSTPVFLKLWKAHSPNMRLIWGFLFKIQIPCPNHGNMKTAFLWMGSKLILDNCSGALTQNLLLLILGQGTEKTG